MGKAKTTQQQTFADLVDDSKVVTEIVEVGDLPNVHIVTIQELSGRQRFQLAEREEESRWDTMLWLCICGMIDPAPPDVETLEKMRMEWIVKIATAIMRISGVEEEDADDAEKGSAAVSEIGG